MSEELRVTGQIDQIKIQVETSHLFDGDKFDYVIVDPSGKERHLQRPGLYKKSTWVLYSVSTGGRNDKICLEAVWFYRPPEEDPKEQITVAVNIGGQMQISTEEKHTLCLVAKIAEDLLNVNCPEGENEDFNKDWDAMLRAQKLLGMRDA